MKKLLLGLGSIASVVAPLAAVISCGDDDNNNNTQAHTVALTGSVFGEITTGLNATLAIPVADVKDAIAGDNFTKNSFHVEHYVKITFKNDTSYDAGTGAQQVKAGETLIIGSTDSRRRVDAAANLKVAYINENDVLQDLTETLASNNKLAALKTGVMDKVIAYLQGQHSNGGNGSTDNATVTPIPATIDPSEPTKINTGAMIQQANLTSLPTTLTEREISPVMGSIKALSNVNTATTIEFILSGFNTSDLDNGTIPGIKFIIHVAAGKAGSLADVVSAASSVTGVPVTGGSDSTGGSGTQTPVIDLDAEAQKVQSTYQSTKVASDLKIDLQGRFGNSFNSDSQAATDLGVTLPTFSSGVSTRYDLKSSYASGNVQMEVTLMANGTNKTVSFEVLPKVALTQTDFNSWTAPTAFTTQTTMLSEASLKAKITAGSITLNNLGLASIATVPNGTQASDYTVALAVDTTMGSANDGWTGGKLALKATITYRPGSLTKTVNVLVTPTAPIDLAGMTSAFWSSVITDVKSPATDADVDATVGSSVAPAHYNSMTAQELTTLFNKPNKTDLTFHGGVTTGDKTFDLKYSMTPLQKGSVKGPFTITVTATAQDGSEVINNTKTFVVTTTMAVGVAKDFIEKDGTITTQLNIGKVGKVVQIDRTISAITDINAEFIDPIVAAIADGAATGTSALKTDIGAATTLLITFNDGTSDHTLTTATFVAGEATDKVKVLAAAKAGTLT